MAARAMTDHSHEVIDVETGELLPVVQASAPVNLFGTDEPAEVIDRAREHARALADVIEQRQLFKQIGQHNHILVEGWTLLGSMLGVFPIVVWTRELDNGFEARVEARTLAGATVGAAEAQCTRDENTWKNRDAYALRSMAQTRATSKALRGPLGFIVQLAGYNPTPAEEMPALPDRGSLTEDAQPRASQATGKASSASEPTISDKQIRLMWAKFREKNMPDTVLRDLALEVCGDVIADEDGNPHTHLIPAGKFSELLEAIEGLDNVPFLNEGHEQTAFPIPESAR